MCLPKAIEFYQSVYTLCFKKLYLFIFAITFLFVNKFS